MYSIFVFKESPRLQAGEDVKIITATASQRAEALLRTIGKWVEK